MDKAKLIGKRADPKTVDVPVEGGSVKVRPLTRAEVLILRGLNQDPAKFERKLLSFAVLVDDDPSGLTEADVKNWQENSPPTEIEDITDKVMEISGLKERAEKAAYKSSSD